MVTLRQGQRIGRYRVDSLLAVGGFARIYRGFDTKRRRRVAIKIPVTRSYLDEAVEAFRHEVHENRKLRPCNVLPVLDFFVLDGVPVIVMPLGRASLADFRDRRLPRARVLRYAHELLLALAHAHAHGVMHLDVKPENLIVLPSGRLALADFGTARRGHRTVVGDRVGTKGYMPPEQAAGHPAPRSDVYAAGVVIGEMLWGESRDAAHTTRRLPPALVRLVDRATQPDPQHRYPDARAMLADFRRIERSSGSVRGLQYGGAVERPRHGRA